MNEAEKKVKAFENALDALWDRDASGEQDRVGKAFDAAVQAGANPKLLFDVWDKHLEWMKSRLATHRTHYGSRTSMESLRETVQGLVNDDCDSSTIISRITQVLDATRDEQFRKSAIHNGLKVGVDIAPYEDEEALFFPDLRKPKIKEAL